jgi:hypothetical protein
MVILILKSGMKFSMDIIEVLAYSEFLSPHRGDLGSKDKI